VREHAVHRDRQAGVRHRDRQRQAREHRDRQRQAREHAAVHRDRHRRREFGRSRSMVHRPALRHAARGGAWCTMEGKEHGEGCVKMLPVFNEDLHSRIQQSNWSEFRDSQ